MGRCEDPSELYGHMWRDVPKAIEIEVVGAGDRLLASEQVEVDRPVPHPPKDRPIVTADAEPVARGRTDAQGRFDLGDDPFACAAKEFSRARWLLVVLHPQGATRACYLILLDANLAHWRGDRDHARFRLDLSAR